MSGNSKEACNTIKAVIEDISRTIQMESTACSKLVDWIQQWPIQITNSTQTVAYSRATRPPQKRLKAYLCWGKRLKRVCAVWKQESLQEWTTFPLICLRIEVGQQQQGQSTVEQIFNSRVITEKHQLHQCSLFHNFINFKKALDRVWHVGLWQVLRSFNIWRTGSTHSSTIWKLQQCSPLEQLAREVLQDNSRCPSGMLTLSLTHPVQLVPSEDHAGNTPWPSHSHMLDVG